MQNKIDYLFIILFIILSFILIINHEPWRDEAQVWLVVKDNPNLISVANLMGNEATPGLWYYILFPFAQADFSYITMLIIHSLIALFGVIIFLRLAPFTRLQKILFIFGYFILYEYNVIARNYVLSVFLLFIIASLYKERFKRPILYSILILLLANTNAHSIVVAIVIAGIYYLEVVSQRKLNIKLIIPSLILIFGFFLAIYQAMPPEDYTLTNWKFDLTAEHVAVIPTSVVGAFLPIPQFKLNFWGSKLLYYPTKYLVILGLPVFLLSLLFLIKKPKPLLIYLISSLGLFSIFFLRHRGGIRHHGLIFIVFIFALWISKYHKEKQFIKNRLIDKLFNKKNVNIILIILFSIHMVASATAVYYELNYDFSASKKTAMFLEENDFINENTFIASYRSSASSAILPYITKRYAWFYCLEYTSFCSYMIWNKAYDDSGDLSTQEIMERIDNAISNKNYENILFISNEKINDGNFNKKYGLIVSFDKTIVKSESFYIYRLNDNI